MKTKNARSPWHMALALALVSGSVLAPTVRATQLPVNLGSAGNFAILAKAGISATGTTTINGDIGISPAAAMYITGFGLVMDPSDAFSTSLLVSGKVYAADYAEPTPTMLGTAVLDMMAAYTDAAGRVPPDATELGAGNISGMTLGPGLYKWATTVAINPGDSLVLTGGAGDVWIFQIGTTLDLGSYASIVLTGGAQPHNVFWQAGTQTTLGTYSTFAGTILDATTIVVMTGARLNGRALSQTSVTLDAVTIPTGIELIEFACASGSSVITLTWRTASEGDNYEWLLERSLKPDGEFTPIASINAGTGSPGGMSYRYIDATVLPNTAYYYRLGDRALNGRITWHGPVMVVSGGKPGDQALLLPCRPNPALEVVNVRYILPVSGMVTLTVYDICGRRVRTVAQGRQQGGEHHLTWNGDDSDGKSVPTGVYLYRLEYEGGSATRRLVLVR